MIEPPPASTPAAGWYPDPSEPSVVRWWDGQQWTHHVQPAPQPAVAVVDKPPWLTNRNAFAAVLGMIVVLMVLFLILDGGGGEPEAPELTAAEAAQADAEAEVAARTAQTALEIYATDNDGAYEGATTEVLQQMEPTLAANLEVEATADSYTVTIPSESGTRFAISRGAEGAITYSCDAPGEGGCPESGDWGAE